MVLADRTSENVRNGRRSRGPSPNGHSGTAQSGAATAAAAAAAASAATVPGGMATDTSSDEENSRKNGNTSKATKAKSEYEEKIRVGRDYQAVCPELIPQPDRKPEALNDRALLVWSPTKEIPDTKLEEYITLAKERYGYNGEQALGMLFWHKHNLERALMDLANFTPFPDEWTAEDRVLFEQAFQFHGKSFHRIRQMLPDKTIASLVKFYYSWKKTRSRTSVMDRQEKLKKNDSSENGSDHGSNEESDNEDKPSPTSASASGQNQAPNSTTTANQSVSNGGSSSNDTSEGAAASLASAGATNENHSGTNDGLLVCTGCGVSCSEVHPTPQGKLCGSCHHHWRRTGVLRPTSGPSCMKKRARGSNILGKSGDSHKRRPPKGMYINHDDIVKLANSEQKIDDASGGGGGGVRKGIPNDDLLAGMDREIVKLLSQIQYNKQTVSGLKHDIDESLEVLKPPEVNTVRLNSRWNNEELMLAVQGVRKYGRDFQAIADTLGSKTEAQVRTFYMNYRRRFSLDAMLKEFEAKNSSSAKEKSSGTGGATVASGGATSNKSSASAKEESNANAATAAAEGQAESTKDGGASAEGDGDVEMIDQQTANAIGGGKEKIKTPSTTSSAEVEIMEVK